MFSTLLSEFRSEGSEMGVIADVAPARFLTKSNTERMIVDSIPRPGANEVFMVTVLTAVETVVVEINLGYLLSLILLNTKRAR